MSTDVKPLSDLEIREQSLAGVRDALAALQQVPAAGLDAPEPITCDRCDALATRSWEGDREFLQLCEGCHDALGRWLDA